MTRRPDAFDRKLAAYRRAHSQTLSPDCDAGSHRACSGDAWNKPRDEPAPCTCRCHLKDQA